MGTVVAEKTKKMFSALLSACFNIVFWPKLIYRELRVFKTNKLPFNTQEF